MYVALQHARCKLAGNRKRIKLEEDQEGVRPTLKQNAVLRTDSRRASLRVGQQTRTRCSQRHQRRSLTTMRECLFLLSIVAAPEHHQQSLNDNHLQHQGRRGAETDNSRNQRMRRFTAVQVRWCTAGRGADGRIHGGPDRRRTRWGGRGEKEDEAVSGPATMCRLTELG